MNKIQVLDCTLRDGGYCNQWQFGLKNSQTITQALVDANVEIIECGFLTQKTEYNSEITKFTTISEISKIIPKKHNNNNLFVAMINCGEYDVNTLPEYDGSSIDGIRVAFHKKDLIKALDDCNIIKQKGYKVFVQPMVSLSYKDEEFLDLIQKANNLLPYAFYIVDSFGMMKSKDLIRLFYMIERNLDKNIKIGFHSHNNLQLAYSNAQNLIALQTNRDLIIDSSIYGMGRGAGNLNTELFIAYLNENYDSKYEIKPLLMVIDRILNEFYQRNGWGYSLPNYLSAIHNAHPNYASYLDDKKTLSVEDMNEIFNLMDNEKKFSFDKNYIENLYVNYMENDQNSSTHKSEIFKKLHNKEIVLIAPGKSVEIDKNKIVSFIKKTGNISISINFDYPYHNSNFIFISNKRRYENLNNDAKTKCIATSNISDDNVYLKVNYRDYITNIDSVKDNAGLMAIKFLIDCGVKKIYLAGFDGYSHDVHENYAITQMEIVSKTSILDTINLGMQKVLQEFVKKVDIEFLTDMKHVKI